MPCTRGIETKPTSGKILNDLPRLYFYLNSVTVIKLISCGAMAKAGAPERDPIAAMVTSFRPNFQQAIPNQPFTFTGAFSISGKARKGKFTIGGPSNNFFINSDIFLLHFLLSVSVDLLQQE